MPVTKLIRTGLRMWRSFAGLNSHRATTTAEVREVDLTEADVVDAVRSSLDAAG